MSQTKAVVETIKISVDQIKPSPYQPRLSFDLEDIRGSIQRDGILVPLTVRDTDGHYELIDGERRLRLAKEFGYETVPCTVISVDDDTARRMVWKVNTLRRDYSPNEKAYYFLKLQKLPYGMSLQGIARECDIGVKDVKAYLNVLKLPKDYQQMVWDRVIPIRNIRELDRFFNGVARATPEENPEIFELLDRSAREKHFGAEQIREAIRPYLAKLREEQIAKAKEVIKEFEPEVKAPETPEELEEAAKVLKREARKKLEAALTPKDKARIEAEKRRRVEERKRRAEEAQQILEEKIKSKVEQEIRAKATEELLNQPELVKELVKRPEIRQALEETKKVEIPPQKKGYLTLEEPLPVQYQRQREWNLKQLVGRRLNGKEFRFDFVTIGYSQKTLQDLVSLLQLAEIRLLIDVRRNPQSMYKPEFNKNRLEKDLTEIGVKYVHLPQLGIPRQARNEVYEGSITPKELLERYERVVLKTNGLSKLLEIVKGKGTFALMCTEVDPTMCHRNKIAQALIEKGMAGYDL